MQVPKRAAGDVVNAVDNAGAAVLEDSVPDPIATALSLEQVQAVTGKPRDPLDPSAVQDNRFPGEHESPAFADVARRQSRVVSTLDRAVVHTELTAADLAVVSGESTDPEWGYLAVRRVEHQSATDRRVFGSAEREPVDPWFGVRPVP